MAAMYEKPVRLLMKDMVAAMGIKPGDVLPREKVFEWFKKNYPKIKDGTLQAHLVRMSTNARNRFHYSANLNGDDDLLYRIDPGKFRLYDASKDPAPIYQEPPAIPPDRTLSTGTDDQSADDGMSEFAYEHDLRNFLAKHLQIIEPGLKLYEEEGITGVEFPVGGRYVDILALDKGSNYVVIELKVSRGYDRVVGQLLRYMAWIEAHHAEPGQFVRGVIIAKEISEDLVLATSKVKDVELFEYELSVSLKKVTTNDQAV